MGRNLGFLIELGALLHPKAVLLVDDGQAQVLENHLAFNQRVGAHHDLHGAISQTRVNLFSLRDFSGTRQQGEVDIHVFQLLLQSGEMLRGQDFRGCHQAGLEAVVQSQEHYHQRHDGLAAAHIALQQAVHLVARAQVLADFLDDALLGVGQWEGEMVFVEAVEIVAHHIEDMAFDGLFAVHLVAQHLELEEEMLLVFQSARGLLDFDVVGRQMDFVIGVTARYQLVFLDECLG